MSNNLDNLNIFESNLDTFRVKSINFDKNLNNNNRWLNIKFYLPDNDCGKEGVGCKLNQGEEKNVNYFIIDKFTKDSNEHSTLIECIENNTLSFDKYGNLAIARESVSPVITNDKDIIYINKLLNQPVLGHLVNETTNVANQLISNNGVITLSDGNRYILYNDNKTDISKGTFYLLYNPIHRKHFKNEVYLQNGPTNSNFGASDKLNWYFITYCYSLYDNGFFGDMSCNCFSPPGPSFQSTRAVDNKSNTSPLNLSTITGLNRATWAINENLTTDESKAQIFENQRPGICLNQYCNPTGNSYDDSFLNIFRSKNIADCNDITLVQQFCNINIDTGKSSEISNAKITNQCSANDTPGSKEEGSGGDSGGDKSNLKTFKCSMTNDEPNKRKYTGTSEEDNENDGIITETLDPTDKDLLDKFKQKCSGMKGNQVPWYGCNCAMQACQTNLNKKDAYNNKLYYTQEECENSKCSKCSIIDDNDKDDKDKDDKNKSNVPIIIGIVIALIILLAVFYFKFIK